MIGKIALGSIALAGTVVCIGQMQAETTGAKMGAKIDSRSIATTPAQERDGQAIESQGGTSPFIDIGCSRIGQTGSDYSEYGVFGGIAAFSGATTACNYGSEVAEWIDGASARHPGIAQQLYRLSPDGKRFEMIGMNWVKHSFCAVSEPTCGNCQATPCSTLGIGCADTYTASRNGSTNLGPRRDFDPLGIAGAGGTHAHPYASPVGNATIRGRLQVQTSDLDFDGARYYWEVHYITHDEALRKRRNNASWVEVNMPPGPNFTSNVSNIGSVRDRETAIRAWKEADPEVLITVAEEMTDGGFYELAQRVFDNGDGTWDYEYLLHNMTSVRAANMFSVPVDDAVSLSNIGFHDVFYHSGDGEGGAGVNYSGTDWSANEGGGAMVWSTETHAQNPNANALRWASSYNFRFTADSPPVMSQATIGIFKPGTPTSIMIDVMVPSAPGVDCVGDIDGNNEVDFDDFVALLAAWGPCVGCDADLDGDDDVDFDDFTLLLANYGPCE